MTRCAKERFRNKIGICDDLASLNGKPKAAVYGTAILNCPAGVDHGFGQVGPTRRAGLRRKALCLKESHPADATYQRADGHLTRPRSFRSLNPLNPDDIRLLTMVSQSEFVLPGLRNADVRQAFVGEEPTDAKERRRSSSVNRKLALLRAQGILKKVPKRHHDRITDKGRQALTTLLAAANATTSELTKLAA